jgi:hypothetical protein
MRKIAAILLLSGFTLSASAYEFGRDTVSDPAACPANSDATANYKWQNGHFVREGWVCQIHQGD